MTTPHAHPGAPATPVVVVGAGVAGLSAAASAAEELGVPGSVILLEKAAAEDAGGNTRWTDAYFRLQDLYEPADGFAEDMAAFSRGRTDPDYVDALVERLPEAMEWVQGHGARFQRRATYFVTASRPRMMPVGGGEALVRTLTDACRRAGVDIRYGAAVVGIAPDDTGHTVSWESDGRRHEVSARTLVLACGGFEGDPQRLRRHLGDAGAGMKPIAPGGRLNTGEVIDAALELGAAGDGEWANFHGEPVDARSTQPEASVMVFPYGLLVNAHGLRFLDEGLGTVDETYEDCSRAILEQPGSRAYLIADAAFLEVPGIQRGLLTDRAPIRAETLEDLAEALEIDPGALRDTVSAYNAAVVPGPYDPGRRDGKHTEGLTPPKTNWALPLDRAPYLGIPLITDIVFTYGGIATDPRARVRDRAGGVMRGLYAAGECTGVYHHKYPGATSVMRGLVFGRVAGTEAAREAGGQPGAPRLPRLLRGELDAEQQALYDTFVSGPRQDQSTFFAVTEPDGALSGPYRAMLLGPAVGSPLERLGRAVRYETGLPARCRELAILTVAHLTDSDVEWRAHEQLALASGVPQASVSAVRRSSPAFESEVDTLVHGLARDLLESHRVEEATFRAAEATFGRAGLFELIVTIGYYQVIAHINNAYVAVEDAAPHGVAPVRAGA